LRVPATRRAARLIVRCRTVQEYGPLHALRHRLLAMRFHSMGAFTDEAYGAIWRDAARQLGAAIVDHGKGYLEIIGDRQATWVWRQYVMLDDVLAFRRALDKEIVHRLLAGENLPIPPHVSFSASDLAPALKFLAASDGSCVVKPADGTGGGVGVTPGVWTRGDLVLASGLASRHSRRLLIERQAPGEMYRLLFLDGTLLDVVRRCSPLVVGDGRSTVRELIAAENRRRLAAGGERGFALLRVDLDCLLTLRNSGRSMRSVPAPGQRVTVKTASSENRREHNETIRDRLDEQLVTRCADAARICGLRLAGVDIVSRDPSQPPRETPNVIIEVNCTPGLNYHYHVRDPARATPVAVPLLRCLLAEEDRDEGRVAAQHGAPL
jgi:D-alanine-D-alanine ligase-like ATP-grasp enzyme